MKKFTPFIFAVIIVLVCSLPLAAQKVIHQYFFNNSFAEYTGGPAVTEMISCSAAAGAFTTEPIVTSGGSCANGASKNVFAFNAGGGVQYPNSSSVVGKSYTIHVLFKFSTLGGWSRIIDFSNSTSDAGIYLYGNCLSFYPNGQVGPSCPFVAGKYYLMSFVRDSVSKVISVFVDGVPYSSYNDASSTYVPSSSTLPVNFFRDDNAVPCEVKAGAVKYISVSNTPLSANGVDSVWKDICSIALPVNLAQFSGTLQGNNAVLKWYTMSESNSAGFVIEHSADGAAFLPIGKVAAAGNSSQKINYQFMHTNLLAGTHYYRLRMTDLDGSFRYSNVVALSTGTKLAFAVYPNPAKSVISVTGLSSAVNQITITTIDSRVVLKTQAVGNSATINVGMLPPGNYFLNYFDGKTTQSKMWVKE